MSGARHRTGVLFLSERADFFGGGQRSLAELAIGLAGNGAMEPCVIVPGPGPLADALRGGGCGVLNLPLPSLRHPLAAGRAFNALLGTLRRLGCRLIHTQSPRAAVYAGVAARLLGLPHLFHLRSSRPSRLLGDALLLALCDRAPAVSRAAAGRSAAARRSSRVRVIPTGMPVPAFLEPDAARAALGLPAGVPVAGIVGRVETDKGAEDAIAALPAIRRAAPGALLVFVGPHDLAGARAQVLRLRIAAYGLSQAVRFAGEWPEASRLLPAFDLLLHPAHHEALPRVLIEAAFAGVPAVGSAVGGVPEVIEDGRTGVLVRPGDPAALGETAGRLLADPARRALLGSAARALARERFDFDRMLDRILALYHEVLAGGARQPETREALP